MELLMAGVSNDGELGTCAIVAWNRVDVDVSLT